MKVRKVVLVFLSFLILSFSSNSQDLNTFYIGHSLSDQIPDMMKSLSEDTAGADFDWVYQSIPGAPLRWQWQDQFELQYYDIEPHYYAFYDPFYGLQNGEFDVLVLTESVPRYTEIIEETYTYVDSFIQYAAAHNPDIQIYIYEPWHCILSGTPTGCQDDIDSAPWRQRLADDLSMWESVVDSSNEKHNLSKPVCLIPAAQGLASLYDLIILGEVEGLSSIDQLFEDNIHLNDWGKYFVACIHYASIFKKSPQGLTNQLYYWWGGEFDPVPIAMAEKFQQIAWQTITDYPLNCLPVSTFTNEVLIDNQFLFPNPFSDFLFVNSLDSILDMVIYDQYGKLVYNLIGAESNKFDLSGLRAGFYFIQYVTKSGYKMNQKMIKM